MSSLRRGHANLLCIVPIFSCGAPRRESGREKFFLNIFLKRRNLIKIRTRQNKTQRAKSHDFFGLSLKAAENVVVGDGGARIKFWSGDLGSDVV